MPKPRETFTIRLATLDDVPVLETLIADSVRVLQAPDYTAEQREAALLKVYGVDTQLIRDGTYYAVEEECEIVACGGWSRRRTLFGGDHRAGREDVLLDPTTEPARIRAFFIRPGWERQGIGSIMMKTCEEAALGEGFIRLELASTLTGIALYTAHGFERQDEIAVPLEEGLTLPVVRMVKQLRG